ISQEGNFPDNTRAEVFYWLPAPLLDFAFGDHAGDLPILASIKHDKKVAITRYTVGAVGVARKSRKPEPQHVHGRAQICGLQSGRRPQQRVPAVAPHDQVGIDLYLSVG